MNLSYLQKPSRYLGNEINSIRKEAEVRVALCLPDTYEIGMSHLGLKILYSIINGIPYASAERVFAPWVDYEGFLRQRGLPLTSLEGRRPLKNFDIVGFSLQYELSYTNVLNMLDLGGIPIMAEERGDRYPLVIAGGPCTTNPMPLTPFIDAFVIGDGEEIIREIIDVYGKLKGQKQELLRALSELEGIYVPSIHQDGRRIKRRIVENLDEAPFPEAPIVPYTSIVHDRVAIEVSRGCTRGCRFCKAGIIYRPLRERGMEKVLSLAHRSISNTGYEGVSFTSLSIGDYSYLLPLIKAFNRRFSRYNISISLPSLRVECINKDILDEIKSVKKTGFTIAPEAGTERLRGIINKYLREEDYERALEGLFSAGWRNIKLYFMIGLPTETEEDIDGIINMIEIAERKGRELTRGSVNINAGISAFVPKPHTPFQWFGQMPFEELRRRQDYLRNSLKRKGFNFKGQHVEVSLLEAVLSRGDKTTAELIEDAWRRGCRFDGWSETFNFELWQRSAEAKGVDLRNYASKAIHINEELPWDIIDAGVKKEFLIKEFQNAFKEQITEDCRFICYNCGLGCKTVVSEKIDDRLKNSHSQHLTLNSKPLTLCIRVWFSKTGPLRYLSHLEVMRALLRAMRRAEIPLAYTKGFHPHPKVSFGPALPVGVEGLNEYLDMEIYSPMDVSQIPAKINAVLMEGLRITKVSEIHRKKSINDSIFRYEYEIEDLLNCIINKNLLNNLMQTPQHLILRDGKTVDIRELIEEVEINDGTIRLILRDSQKTRVRLYEVLKEIFHLSTNELYELRIKRTNIYG